MHLRDYPTLVKLLAVELYEEVLYPAISNHHVDSRGRYAPSTIYDVILTRCDAMQPSLAIDYIDSGTESI